MMSGSPNLDQYLDPTEFIDSDHPAVRAFASEVALDQSSHVEQAIALYLAVRDGIRYDPYRIDLSPAALRASAVLAKGYGFCVAKAVLLAAVARARGIPSRLGFADVKNHLTTEKLRRLMQTDIFAFHGYSELYLEQKWVKATPAFNSSLCERFDVEPLAFDGRNDSLLQQHDRKGGRYMEYVRDHGQFADLPLKRMLAAFQEHYPALMAQEGYHVGETFEDDAAKERGGNPS
jgi:transglutaminase-like putative cysteine protease